MPSDDIHKGHRLRLKSRFLSHGLDDFEPHNILELLLFFGIPRVDTNEIAHVLLKRFGSISGVFDAPYEELVKVKGVTANAAVLMKMIPKVAGIYMQDKVPKNEPFSSPEKLGRYFTAKFIGKTNETVFLLCMDSALNAIDCTLLNEGTVTSTNVSIKRIVENVLRCNAARVAISHNHPRGLAVPSNEDVTVTFELKKALSMLGVDLVDHIIVAGNEYYSMAQHYPNL